MPPAMRKMDIPIPVVEWLATVKAELVMARKRNVTWPEVWEHIMQQQKAADQAMIRIEGHGVRQVGR